MDIKNNIFVNNKKFSDAVKKIKENNENVKKGVDLVSLAHQLAKRKVDNLNKGQ